MIVTTTLDEVMSKPLTPEQLKMLDEMMQKPIEPDEDCPAYSYEELMAMKRAADDRRNKQNVTIRLTPAALEKAKRLGKGYTGVLARLIENGLNDPEALRKAL